MMQPAAHERKTEAGFSLVEVLVSLTLLAMILALLPGAFRTGKRGWETAAVIEQRAASDASIDYLRHRIAEAAAVFDKDESGRSRIAFNGGDQDLSFVAPAPSGPGGGGLYRFTVAAPLGASARPADLTLSMTPYRQLETQADPVVSKHVLLPAIRSLKFRYFGIQTDGEKPAWSDAWLRQDQLPVLIELQADSADNAGKPMRVELKTTAGS